MKADEPKSSPAQEHHEPPRAEVSREPVEAAEHPPADGSPSIAMEAAEPAPQVELAGLDLFGAAPEDDEKDEPGLNEQPEQAPEIEAPADGRRRQPESIEARAEPIFAPTQEEQAAPAPLGAASVEDEPAPLIEAPAVPPEHSPEPVTVTKESAPAVETPAAERASPFWPLRFESPFGPRMSQIEEELSSPAPINGAAREPMPAPQEESSEVDDALLRELELTLDHEREATPSEDAKAKGKQSLNEEMDRLLSDLVGERR